MAEQLSAVMKKVANRNVLERASKFTVTANILRRVGRALDEIEVDCAINQTAVILFGSVSQDDPEEFVARVQGAGALLFKSWL